MRAEQRVVLPRGIQELVGIVFSDVKIQVAAECSCEIFTPKSTLILTFCAIMGESINIEYLSLLLI